MRAGEIRALAERAGIAPGVSVLDLCCGVAGPGRFITRELGCGYLGVDQSASAVDIARVRARGLPCRFEVAQVPPLPPGTFDVVLLLETMLAFPDKEPLLQGISRALTAGGRFAFTLEEGAPLTEPERTRMPDADTVWLTPLEEMRALLERAGLIVRWQDDCSRVPPRHGGVADRRVRRRCDGHRRADRAPGAGRAAGRPPALERLARDGARPQDRVRGGEAGSERACSPKSSWGSIHRDADEGVIPAVISQVPAGSPAYTSASAAGASTLPPCPMSPPTGPARRRSQAASGLCVRLSQAVPLALP